MFALKRDNRLSVFFLIGIVGGGVHLGLLGTAATNRPTERAPGDYDGDTGGMIGRGNRSTRRKPAQVPLCPPQTSHAARTRTRAAEVRSQRLTAWATARPIIRLISDTLSAAVEILTRHACSGVSSITASLPVQRHSYSEVTPPIHKVNAKCILLIICLSQSHTHGFTNMERPLCILHIRNVYIYVLFSQLRN
jgi:hypothetical protein